MKDRLARMEALLMQHLDIRPHVPLTPRTPPSPVTERSGPQSDDHPDHSTTEITPSQSAHPDDHQPGHWTDPHRRMPEDQRHLLDDHDEFICDSSFAGIPINGGVESLLLVEFVARVGGVVMGEESITSLELFERSGGSVMLQNVNNLLGKWKISQMLLLLLVFSIATCNHGGLVDEGKAITGDSIVLKFEKARSALEESLKRVEDIVPQAIGCQVLVIVNELQRTIFTLDPLENQVGDDGSAPCSPIVLSSFEEGSGPGSNDQDLELQLSKVSSFNFRPSCRRSGQITVPPDELKCPISLQLKYYPVIISFATSTLKSLVEQSKYDPCSSQSQTIMRLASQCNENDFELEVIFNHLTLLEHIKLVEENDGLHLEKQKLAEEASYAKIMYSNLSPHGHLKLYKFTAMLTAVMIVLSQLPSFHYLKYINLVSVLLTLGYTSLVVGSCIHTGHKYINFVNGLA
ncbi:hypothetical protein Syun_003576 [Stephania yunnanensis]|uniref:Uncharacterized protein n=1 Tax=Stephania yunnanensis TaxID=152371 RepID=A0AAP0L5C8_9MAGN